MQFVVCVRDVGRHYVPIQMTSSCLSQHKPENWRGSMELLISDIDLKSDFSYSVSETFLSRRWRN